ncbi:MAG TPA: hypothetical protein VFW30_06865 [Bryocella sp.]|nr:hypothetical protein [Bryocella sp.]
MFWFIIDVLALRKLGLSRPFRYILLIFFIGCMIAGVIYAGVVMKAISERSNNPHVSTHSSH